MTPYYEHAGITIYHGDCREILPTLDPVDLVVTDPPYGVDYAGGQFNPGRERMKSDTSDVYCWAIPMMFEVCRGPCYVFFSDTRTKYIFDAIADARGQVHAMIIWHKTNATYAAMNAQYKQRHEPFLYCKGPKSKTRWVGASTESTLWEMRRAENNILHPTQKPPELAERCIRNHDVATVLDPFAGSGSFLVGAKAAGIKAIGIEIEEKYCEIAAKRLGQEVFEFEAAGADV